MVLYFFNVCGFSALGAEKPHTEIMKYLAAAGKKVRLEDAELLKCVSPILRCSMFRAKREASISGDCQSSFPVRVETAAR